MKTAEKYWVENNIKIVNGEFMSYINFLAFVAGHNNETKQVVDDMKEKNTKEIVETISDKRYDRSNPAIIFSNAPLALMQQGWEVKVDTLREFNIALTELKSKIGIL